MKNDLSNKSLRAPGSPLAAHLAHVVELPDGVLQVQLTGQRVDVGVDQLLELLPGQDGEGLALLALAPDGQDGEDGLAQDRDLRLLLDGERRVKTEREVDREEGGL